MWDLSLLSSREWRISHAFSHHLYTNTYYDIELAALEPLLVFAPSMSKIFIQKYAAPFYVTIVYGLATFVELGKRCVLIVIGKERLYPENLLPLAEGLLVWMVNGDIFVSAKIWFTMHVTCSLWMIYLSTLASHRHPELYNAGDNFAEYTVRNDLDWGVHQLDAGYDVTGKSDHFIWKMTTFGDHRLHHLFPTVDQSKLQYLYPVVEQTCKDFDVPFETRSAWNMFVGHFNLIWKNTPRHALTP